MDVALSWPTSSPGISGRWMGSRTLFHSGDHSKSFIIWISMISEFQIGLKEKKNKMPLIAGSSTGAVTALFFIKNGKGVNHGEKLFDYNNIRLCDAMEYAKK